MEVRQAGTKMKLSRAKFEISDYHSGKNEKTTEKRGMYVQKKVKEWYDFICKKSKWGNRFDYNLLCAVCGGAVSDTTLENEYNILSNIGFSYEQLKQISLNTIDAAFLSEKEKEELKSYLK